MQVKNNVCPFCNDGTIIKIHHETQDFFHWECDNCKTYIENDMLTGQSPVISLAGAKQSTKTNFMYFLLASIKENGPLKQSLHITNDRFVSDGHEIKYQDEIRKILGGNFLEQTGAGEIETLIYRLTRHYRKLYLTLKDTGGEEFDSPVNIIKTIPYILQSDGIILLIDPIEFPKVRDIQTQLGNNRGHIYKPAKDVVGNLYEAIKVRENNKEESATPEPTEPEPALDPSIFGHSFIDSETWMANVKRRVASEESAQKDQRIQIPIAVCIAKFDLVMDCVNHYIPNEDYFFDYRDMIDSTSEGLDIIKHKSDLLRNNLPKLGTRVVADIEQLFANVSYFPIILAKPTADLTARKFNLEDHTNFNRGALTPLIWLLDQLNYIR